VEGIYLIAEKGAKGIFHISGSDIMTPYQMALDVADFLKLDKNLLEPVDALTFTQIGKRPQKTGFKIEKAVRELGYHPTSFKNALSMIF
jgi:dTDP-4-dehydrorhamnose reductase